MVSLDQLIPLISGLVGAIIGGLIVFISSYYIERMRHKQELKTLKIEFENQRKTILFDKLKTEKIEAYKNLIGCYFSIRDNLHSLINIKTMSDEFDKRFKNKDTVNQKDLNQFGLKISSNLNIKLPKEFEIEFDRSDYSLYLSNLYNDTLMTVMLNVKDVYQQIRYFQLFTSDELQDIITKFENNIVNENFKAMNRKNLEQWFYETEDILNEIESKMKEEIESS